ncbi:MAG: HAD family hydrolase, partial [Dethiobacteria bacterium]|nr:HAD family hydrolase [Dethiobacteria bacterium]
MISALNSNENTRFNHILFDLDGTLTDSAEGVTRSVQYALQMYGIIASLEDLRSFIGPPLHWSFENSYGFSKAKAFQAVEYYREYYREKGIFENKLYPNITEMLEALSKSGANLYVATSKPTVFALQVLQYFNIDRFFATIAGSNLDGTRVDKSEVIDFVLTNNEDIDKNRAVMVGDRKHDIIGARTCGLNSIAVTYGYGSPTELTTA